MNQVIIVLPTQGYDAAQSDATTFVFETTLQAKAFERVLRDCIQAFIVGYQPLYHGIALLDTDMDESHPSYEEKLSAFERTYAAAEEFEQKHFLFEDEGQYLDVRQFTRNKQEFETFEVYDLSVWLEQKQKQVRQKPAFSSY